MSDFIPKPGAPKVGGLNRKAQKLQAMLEKAANAKSGAKPSPGAASLSSGSKPLPAGVKKTAFQRKAT